MTDAAPQSLEQKYNSAADKWSDKMRALGYYDAYLGFLSASGARANPGVKVVDIGCGTAAFSEAWVAIHGADVDMHLLDPSAAMLERGTRALAKRSVDATGHQIGLAEFNSSLQFDHLLAAHVIEHATDPVEMLSQMRANAESGSKLWLIVSKPHWCNAIVWLQWRHRAYPHDHVEGMLRNAGWVLDDVYAFPSGPPSRTSRGYLATAH